MDRGERAKKSADASVKRKAVKEIKKKNEWNRTYAEIWIWIFCLFYFSIIETWFS